LSSGTRIFSSVRIPAATRALDPRPWSGRSTRLNSVARRRADRSRPASSPAIGREFVVLDYGASRCDERVRSWRRLRVRTRTESGLPTVFLSGLGLSDSVEKPASRSAEKPTARSGGGRGSASPQKLDVIRRRREFDIRYTPDPMRSQQAGLSSPGCADPWREPPVSAIQLAGRAGFTLQGRPRICGARSGRAGVDTETPRRIFGSSDGDDAGLSREHGDMTSRRLRGERSTSSCLDHSRERARTSRNFSCSSTSSE